MNDNGPSEFYLLQIKPMLISNNKSIDLDIYKQKDIFASSHITLGNGTTNEIKDLLYLPPEKYDPSKSKEIAKEIGYFNEKIGKDNPYILSGPGRWGSADPWLGVPITGNKYQIQRLLLSLGMKISRRSVVWKSFFQNITSLHMDTSQLTIKI